MVFEKFNFIRDRLETIQGKEIRRDVQVLLKPVEEQFDCVGNYRGKVLFTSSSSHLQAVESEQVLLADLVQEQGHNGFPQ